MNSNDWLRIRNAAFVSTILLALFFLYQNYVRGKETCPADSASCALEVSPLVLLAPLFLLATVSLTFYAQRQARGPSQTLKGSRKRKRS